MRVPGQPETFPAIPVLSGIQPATDGLAGFPAAFRFCSPGRVAVGTKAVIGVIVIVVIGLVIRAAIAKWRATRQERQAQAELPPVKATSG